MTFLCLTVFALSILMSTRPTAVLCQECEHYKALGLRNHQIKDEDITSSSHRQNHPPYYARIGHDNSWCAGTRDKYQWLQVDLHQTRELLFMATQGNGVDAWVQTFYVEFSMDNITWYCFGNEIEAFLIGGNNDASIVKFSTFIPAIRTRYIRINPYSWENDICLRVELYGCPYTGHDTAMPSYKKETSCGIKRIVTTQPPPTTTPTTTPIIPISELWIRIAKYAMVNQLVFFNLHPHFGTSPTYKWKTGTGDVFITKKRFHQFRYKYPGVYEIQLIAFNAVSNRTANATIIIQYPIAGLSFVGGIKAALPGHPVNFSWHMSQGTNVTITINPGDGSRPATMFVHGSGKYHHTHTYLKQGYYQPAIEATNLVSPKTSISSEVYVELPITDITTSILLPRGKSKNVTSRYYICVGDVVTIFARAMVDGYVSCSYNFNDSSGFVLSPNHRYSHHGVFSPFVVCNNHVSDLTRSLNVTLIAQRPEMIGGLAIESRPTVFGNPVSVLLRMSTGNCFLCKWDLGDGDTMETDFSDLGLNITHNFTREGEYSVVIDCSNILGRFYVQHTIYVHIPIEGLEIVNYSGFYVASHSSVSFSIAVQKGSSLKYRVDFEDNEYHVAFFKDNLTVEKVYFFRHTFIRPGVRRVCVEASNALGSKLSCLNQTILVQNPLKGVSLSSDSPVRLSIGIINYTISIQHQFVTPSNVTCSWDFGDETKTRTLPLVFNKNSKYQLSHHYTQHGKYITKANCSNKVSQLNFTEEVYVHKLLGVIITIGSNKSEVLCTSDRNRTSECFLPLGFEFKFKVTSQELDVRYVWDLKYNRTQAQMQLATFQPFLISHRFNNTGIFELRVTVENILETFTAILRIGVEEKLIASSFSSDNFTLLRSPTTFIIQLKEFGTNACYLLDFGDGRKSILGENACEALSVEYNITWIETGNTSIVYDYYYTNKGEFVASLHGFNRVSYVRMKTSVIVKKPICKVLYLNITLGNSSVMVAAEKTFNYTKASSFAFNFSYGVTCLLAENIHLQWNVWQTDSYDGPESKVNISSTKMSSSILNVATRALDYGRYRLEAVVSSKGQDIRDFYSETDLSKSIYVNIVPSAMIAIIEGGKSRSIGYDSLLILDGSFSHDPDVGVGQTDKGLLFDWYCSIAEASAGCFSSNRNVPFSHNKAVSMPTTNLTINVEYHFELVISKAGRMASYEQSVVVKEGTPPSMEIRYKEGFSGRIITTSKLVIISTCKDCLPNSKIFYQWQINLKTSDNEWTYIPLPDAYTNTGTDKPNLVVRPGFFTPGGMYLFKLYSWRVGGKQGMVEFVADTNANPTNGTCSAKPVIGKAMSTLFKITCNGWNDSDLPLSYRFVYLFDDNTNIIYSGSQSQASSQLPMGSTYANYTLKVLAEVLDSLGAVTRKTLTVKVIRPVSVNYSSLLSSVSNIGAISLGNSTQQPDIKKVLGQITSIGSFLNTLAEDNTVNGMDSNEGGSIAGDSADKGTNATRSDNGTTIIGGEGKNKANNSKDEGEANTNENTKNEREEQEKKREEKKKRIQMRETILLQVSAVPVTSLNSLVLTSNAISTLTKKPDEISSTAQSATLNFLPTISSFLRETSRKEQSAEKVEKIGKTVLESLSNVINKRRVLSRETKDKCEVTALNGMLFNLSFGAIRMPGDMNQAAEKYTRTDVDVNIVEFPKNIFIQSNGAPNINSPVVGLELKDNMGRNIPVQGLKNEVKITINYNIDHAYMPNKLSLTSKSLPRAHIFERKRNDSSISLQMTTYKQSSGVSSIIFLVYPGDRILSSSPLLNLTTSPEHLTDDLTVYRAFLIKEKLNFTGDYSVIIRTVVSEVYQSSWSAGNISMTYSLEGHESSCYYWDDVIEEWMTNGCRVGVATTSLTVECLCNHLTAFGTGLSVLPIRVSYIGGVLSFSGSKILPIVFTMVIVIFGLYVLILVWARREDLRDNKRAETFSLEGNCSTDEGQYEVILSTGLRQDAGTTARVFCVLSGDSNTTAARCLSDPSRVRFKRGAQDSFLLTTPNHFGKLRELKVWHDDSGTSPSWFLSSVIVHDLISGQTYQFLCNRWLSIEYEDGQVERSLYPATNEELNTFRTLFYKNIKSCLVEYHLWISVFFRPAKGNFTRTQRITCCLALVYTVIIVASVVYKLAENDFKQKIIIPNLPVRLTGYEIAIGILIGLCMVPITIVFSAMFRSIEQKPTKIIKISRHLESDEDISPEFYFELQTKERKEEDEFEDIVKWLENSESHNELNDVDASNHTEDRTGELNFGFSESVLEFPSEEELVESSSINEGGSTTSTGKNQKRNEENYTETKRRHKSNQLKSTKLEKHIMKNSKKKLKGKLPYKCVWIAWLLLGLVVFSSAFFAVIIGVQLKYDLVEMLVWSVTVALLQDILINEGVNVLLLSLYMTIKNKDENERPKDITLIVLNDDENNAQQMDESLARCEIPVQSAYDQKRQEKRMKRRINEVKLMQIVKELMVYLLFLGCLAVVGFGQRDSKTFHIVKGLRQVFEGSYSNLSKAKWIDGYWERLNYTILAGLSSSNGYDYECKSSEDLMIDCTTNVLGVARLRQLRIKQESCSVAGITRSIIKTCNGDYNIFDEDQGQYGPGWVSIQSGPGTNMSGYYDPWIYRTASDLGSYPYVGQIKTYTGGGFAVEINSSSTELINDLKEHHWIDELTRAVFVEFSLYNVPTNLFIYVSLVTEIMSTNGMVRFDDIKVAQLNGPQDGKYLAVLGCQLISMVFLVTFIYKEVKKLYRLRRQYFQDPWNWIEITILVSIGMSVVVLILRDMEKAVAFDSSKPTERSKDAKFINLSSAATIEELLTCTMGMLIFFSNLKLLKLMKFSRRIVIFSKSLSIAAPSLLSFFAVFLVFFTGFSSLYYLTIGPYAKNYRSFIDTLETMLSTLLGGFDYDIMVRQLSIIGPVFFSLFMVFVVIILMNIFLAIIIDSITEANKGETVEDEDAQLFAFGMRKLKEKFNLKKNDDDDDISADNQSFEEENAFLAENEANGLSSLSDEFTKRIDVPCEKRVDVPQIQIECTTSEVGSVRDIEKGMHSIETSSFAEREPTTSNSRVTASVPCLKHENLSKACYSTDNTKHQSFRKNEQEIPPNKALSKSDGKGYLEAVWAKRTATASLEKPQRSNSFHFTRYTNNLDFQPVVSNDSITKTSEKPKELQSGLALQNQNDDGSKSKVSSSPKLARLVASLIAGNVLKGQRSAPNSPTLTNHDDQNSVLSVSSPALRWWQQPPVSSSREESNVSSSHMPNSPMPTNRNDRRSGFSTSEHALRWRQLCNDNSLVGQHSLPNSPNLTRPNEHSSSSKSSHVLGSSLGTTALRTQSATDLQFGLPSSNARTNSNVSLKTCFSNNSYSADSYLTSDLQLSNSNARTTTLGLLPSQRGGNFHGGSTPNSPRLSKREYGSNLGLPTSGVPYGRHSAPNSPHVRRSNNESRLPLSTLPSLTVPNSPKLTRHGACDDFDSTKSIGSYLSRNWIKDSNEGDDKDEEKSDDQSNDADQDKNYEYIAIKLEEMMTLFGEICLDEHIADRAMEELLRIRLKRISLINIIKMRQSSRTGQTQ